MFVSVRMYVIQEAIIIKTPKNYVLINSKVKRMYMEKSNALTALI